MYIPYEPSQVQLFPKSEDRPQVFTFAFCFKTLILPPVQFGIVCSKHPLDNKNKNLLAIMLKGMQIKYFRADAFATHTQRNTTLVCEAPCTVPFTCSHR